MITAPKPLEVLETRERMRFHVRSEKRPLNVYLVDLLEHGGVGECQCKDWRTRCWPLIRDGGRSDDPEVFCKHVVRARVHFLDQLLARMAADEAR